MNDARTTTVADASTSTSGEGSAGPSEPSASPPRARRGIVRRVAMKPRGVFVRLHRWLSFVLLAWLVVVSVTGLVLVLDDHLDHWMNPELFEHHPGDQGPDVAVAAARTAVPKDATLDSVTLPANAAGVYFVNFAVPKPAAPEPAEGEDPLSLYPRVYVDPGTAEVNGVRKPYDEGFLWWMYRGHIDLWQDGGLFGVDNAGGWCEKPSGWFNRGVCTAIPAGDDMIAWFAVGWMVVLTSGFYLWYWPGVRRWARAVRVRRGRGAFTFSLDLHKAVGLVVVLPLLVVSFTGAAFAFPLIGNLFDRATPAQAKFELWEAPEAANTSKNPGGGVKAITIAEAVAVVHRTHPTWRIDLAMPPADGEGIHSFWADKGFSTWTAEGGGGNTLINVDQYSGKILYTGAPSEGNVFDQAWDDWSFPVHTGDVFGEASRIPWALLAISPLMLGGTGIAMNRIRHRKRKRRAGPPAPAGDGSSSTSEMDVNADVAEGELVAAASS